MGFSLVLEIWHGLSQAGIRAPSGQPAPGKLTALPSPDLRVQSICHRNHCVPGTAWAPLLCPAPVAASHDHSHPIDTELLANAYPSW